MQWVRVTCWDGGISYLSIDGRFQIAREVGTGRRGGWPTEYVLYDHCPAPDQNDTESFSVRLCDLKRCAEHLADTGQLVHPL